MSHATRPGDVLGDRYLLGDLLVESGGGRFWRAHDRVLERHVAIHVIAADDQRAPSLMEAARRASTVLDRRILRVLDAEVNDEVCYVVNEWAWGSSFDHVVATTTLGPRRAAWVVAEVADSIAAAHSAGVPHGRLVPENVLVDRAGGIRLIGHGVDAALHGKTNTRAATDVTDLAGLLYCLLTGRWAGLSESAVPTAPREHGEVLRPRRVRAGVPRPIDLLCDAVLHAHAVPRSVDLGDVHTARGIATYLEEYVGDPTGIPEALLGDIPPVPTGGVVTLPPVPEITVEDDVPLDDDPPVPPPRTPPRTPARTPPLEPDPVPVVDVEPPAEPATELPTQAGLPIFDDDGDVSWLERRTDPVPPPPPFEDPPERPLFAPDPPDGVSRRPRTPPPRPMPPMADPDPVTDSSSTRLKRAEGFWPFAGGTGHGDTGSGLYAIGTEDGHVPGRRWLRLATGLAAILLLVVAVVVAVNLQSDGEPEPAGGEDDNTTSAPQSPSDRAAQPLRGVVASALDPQGTDGGENDDSAPLAVDGNRATAWTTQTYFDQLGPDGGLKSGVGLTLDLGEERSVSAVDLRLDGAPTDVELYASDSAPTDVAGLDRVAAGTAEGDDLSLAPDGAVTARYVVVWLTSLPADGSDFRGSIAEVVVRGE